MFERLKKLFRRAEAEVEKKAEEKIEAAPPVEVEPAPQEAPEARLAPEVIEAMREVEAEKKPAKPKPVERLKETPKREKPIKITEEKPKAEKRPAVREEPIERELETPVEERPPERFKETPAESDKRVEKKIKIGFAAKLKTALGAKARLSESEISEITWNLQMGLMESDVAMEVADAITAELKQKLSSAEFKDPRGQVRGIFKETLVDILEAGGELDFLDFVKNHEKPVKIVFFGINGTGKTTSIGKVAHLLKRNGLSVVVAAGDTFRAGAQEQLAKHAERVGVEMVHHQRGGDAAAVVFDAVKHAKATGIDVVLADTSGRMQSDADLMGEMEKIVRVNKPDFRVFVGDALTGNDAVEQAREFNSKIGIDATILAKCDASKGGAALSVSYITKKPIIFLGMGQGYDDLKPFDAREFVDEIV